MPLKIYCDTGAYQPPLAELERRGLVSVHQFKYENRNRRIRNSAPPSNPSWKHMNYTWDEMRADQLLGKLTYDDLARTSSNFEALVALLGRQCEVDAKHLDSAVMSRCEVFLTTDKDDIWSRGKEIEKITGLRVLYMPDEWDALDGLIQSNGRAER